MNINLLTEKLGQDAFETDVKINTVNLTTVSTLLDAMLLDTLELPSLVSLYPYFKGGATKEGRETIKKFYEQWKEIEITEWLSFLLLESSRKRCTDEIRSHLKANIKVAIVTKLGLADVADDFLAAVERVSRLESDLEAEADEINSLNATITEMEGERDHLQERVTELEEDLGNTRLSNEPDATDALLDAFKKL